VKIAFRLAFLFGGNGQRLAVWFWVTIALRLALLFRLAGLARLALAVRVMGR
jgi:hypothetical protein